MANTKEKKVETPLTYNENIVITCSCGAQYQVGSTQKDITVEICSNCHPFYTGNQKFVDAGGRLEKFKAKVAAGNAYKEKQAKAPKKAKEPKKEEMKESDDTSANS